MMERIYQSLAEAERRGCDPKVLMLMWMAKAWDGQLYDLPRVGWAKPQSERHHSYWLSPMGVAFSVAECRHWEFTDAFGCSYSSFEEAGWVHISDSRADILWPLTPHQGRWLAARPDVQPDYLRMRGEAARPTTHPTAISWLGQQRLRVSEPWPVTLEKKWIEYDRNNRRWPWELSQGDRAPAQCEGIPQSSRYDYLSPRPEMAAQFG